MNLRHPIIDPLRRSAQSEPKIRGFGRAFELLLIAGAWIYDRLSTDPDLFLALLFQPVKPGHRCKLHRGQKAEIGVHHSAKKMGGKWAEIKPIMGGNRQSRAFQANPGTVINLLYINNFPWKCPRGGMVDAGDLKTRNRLRKLLIYNIWSVFGRILGGFTVQSKRGEDANGIHFLFIN